MAPSDERKSRLCIVFATRNEKLSARSSSGRRRLADRPSCCCPSSSSAAILFHARLEVKSARCTKNREVEQANQGRDARGDGRRERTVHGEQERVSIVLYQPPPSVPFNCLICQQYNMSETHIRPKVRKSNKTTSNKAVVIVAHPSDDNDDDDKNASIEATRLRMESWTGLKSSSSSSTPTKDSINNSHKPVETRQQAAAAAAAVVVESKPTTVVETKQKEPTASILKTPKYSKPLLKEQETTNTKEEDPDTSISGAETSISSTSNPVICKDIIVERDPTCPPPIRTPNRSKIATSHNNHDAVEGYVPTVQIHPPTNAAASQAKKKTDNDEQNDDNDDEPLILNSLEELFQAAGQEMPPNPSKITPDTQLVEADISFSVMTQEQYDGKFSEIKREQAQDREAQLEMFLGNENIFGEEDNNGELQDDDDDDDDDDLLEMFMEQDLEDDYNGDDNHDNQDTSYQEPRAFRKLWDALLDWTTQEAVEWITRLETPGDDESKTFSGKWTPQVDRSDVGASRCAGLMAMVKMYLPSSMKELNRSSDIRRKAEKRLGDLLRTFDYSREAPKLEVKLWKAMTCIFLDMVLVETRADPLETAPPSVQAIGMTIDEYRYLTRSAVQTFGKSLGL